MTVGSYIELHTTLLGWLLYGRFWEVLTQTGLAFLPFLFLLIDNWTDPALSQNQRPAADVSIKRMTYGVIMTLFAIVLAVQPVIPITPGLLKYQPPPTPSTPNPGYVTAADDGTTYGRTGFITDGDGSRAPILWYLVMALAEGLNRSFTTALPGAVDIRGAQQQILGATLHDPGLTREVGDFSKDCYLPAQAKLRQWAARRDPRDLPTELDAALAKHGNEDTAWIGSRVFLETRGLYRPCNDASLCGASLQSTTPRAGWPYRAARDGPYNEIDLTGNVPGRPYCDEWWGRLKQQILAIEGVRNLGLGWWDRLWVFVQNPLDPDQQADELVRTVLRNSAQAHEMIPTEYAYYNTSAQSALERKLASGTKRFFGVIGTGMESAKYAVVMNTVLQALPMIQAVLLMAIYALLPLMLVLGKYDWGTIFVFALVIFSVKFLTTLWHLAWWIDLNLVFSLYPDGMSLAKFLQGIPQPGALGTKRMLLDMITTGLYLALPVLWFIMMGWVGFQGVGALRQGIDTMGSGAARAGGQAAGQAMGAARMAGTAGRNALRGGRK